LHQPPLSTLFLQLCSFSRSSWPPLLFPLKVSTDSTRKAPLMERAIFFLLNFSFPPLFVFTLPPPQSKFVPGYCCLFTTLFFPLFPVYPFFRTASQWNLFFSPPCLWGRRENRGLQGRAHTPCLFFPFFLCSQTFALQDNRSSQFQRPWLSRCTVRTSTDLSSRFVLLYFWEWPKKKSVVAGRPFPLASPHDRTLYSGLETFCLGKTQPPNGQNTPPSGKTRFPSFAYPTGAKGGPPVATQH